MPSGVYIKTEEHKRKISEAHKGKPKPPFSEEHKRKMSEARIGRTYIELHGLEKAEEIKRKQSEAKKGKFKSTEHSRKISEANKGKPKPPRSEETKRKISETLIKLYDEIGRSDQEYCPIFANKGWRQLIYIRDKNSCQNCGCTKQLNFKLNGRKVLTIHHINHDKKDCGLKNCILLCLRCNTVVEGKKVKKIYENLFQMKLFIEKGYSYNKEETKNG